jgi:hypothetical protein
MPAAAAYEVVGTRSDHSAFVTFPTPKVHARELREKLYRQLKLQRQLVLVRLAHGFQSWYPVDKTKDEFKFKLFFWAILKGKTSQSLLQSAVTCFAVWVHYSVPLSKRASVERQRKD